MPLTHRDFLSEDAHSPGILHFGGARMALLDIEAGFWGLRRQMESLVGRRLTNAVLQQAGANGGASFARSFLGSAAMGGVRALRDCIAAYQAAGFGRFEVETLEWPLGYVCDKPIGRVVIRAWDTFEAWMMRRYGQQSERPVCAYSAGVLVGFVNILAGRRDVVCIERTCQAQGAEACLFELLPAEAADDVPVVGFSPDPALGRQLNLLEILFERMPMGIAIFDRDLRLRRCNPTWATFIDRYTPSTASQVVPGAYFFDLSPGTEGEVMPIFERVLAGETVRLEALRLESKGIASYWDVVFAPLIEDEKVVGFVDVTTDATERKQVEKELREREVQYRSIFESTSDSLLIFDFDGTIVEANPAACKMYGYSYEELIGLSGRDIVHPDYHFHFENFKRQVRLNGHFSAQSIDRRKDGNPINVEVHGTSFSYKGKPHLLAVVRDITERILAQQILEQRVKERTRELSMLLEVSHNVASALELEPLLGLILDQLRVVVDYDGAAVMILEGKNLALLSYRGPIPQEDALRLCFPLERALVNREVIRRREPVIIPDVRGDAPLARTFQQTAGEELETTFGYIRSWMGVPLIVKDRVIGMLTLDHSEPNHYSPRQAELALAFANHAAVAIENAQLYRQARELAAIEERSRLARDLHDAVTQTLFSASLIAEVLPRLWERDPDEGQRRLSELRELTRGALAEMRTLLLELRPATLTEMELKDLLHQLAEAITGRARVSVTVEIEGQRPLPVEVKVALYRIAQEALNNVAKHAAASQAVVNLQCQPGQVTLRVSDDGRGFDTQNVPSESLGLSIMRERAEAIGAALKIDSQIGHGTEVVAIWKDRTGEKQ